MGFSATCEKMKATLKSDPNKDSRPAPLGQGTAKRKDVPDSARHENPLFFMAFSCSIFGKENSVQIFSWKPLVARLH
ncbi:hypothetical protein F9K50_06845 [bacterium]|nr:MAG: hypothetical protein F9K50_06845 [bacterium]